MRQRPHADPARGAVRVEFHERGADRAARRWGAGAGREGAAVEAGGWAGPADDGRVGGVWVGSGPVRGPGGRGERRGVVDRLRDVGLRDAGEGGLVRVFEAGRGHDPFVRGPGWREGRVEGRGAELDEEGQLAVPG